MLLHVQKKISDSQILQTGRLSKSFDFPASYWDSQSVKLLSRGYSYLGFAGPYPAHVWGCEIHYQRL